jgi:hypothetical protein
MIVFKLQHAHLDPAYDDVSEIFDIGIYSSRALAEAAAARLRQQPGFSDTPDGFQITEVEVDQTSWEEGYECVPAPDLSE